MYQQTRLPQQVAQGDVDFGDAPYVQVPQGQPLQQQQGQGAPSAGPPQDLAEVEGLTDKYYDTYGKLNALAHGMWKDYGLDVTTPDFTQPGGGTPFKTYQKLSAVLMHTSNKLGNRLKQQVQMQPLIAQGKTIETKPGEYTPTELLPEVAATVDAAQKEYYTGRDAARGAAAHIEPVLAKMRARSDADSPFIQNQIRVLESLHTAYVTHPSYFKAEADDEKAKRKAAAKAAPELGVLKKMTSYKNGAWKDYTMKTDPETQQPAAFNGELQGTPVKLPDGKIHTIAGLYRRPDKSTWAYFNPKPDEDPSPPIRVDNMSGDQFTAWIQENNPTYGKASNTSAAIQILGHQDIGGNVDEPSLYGEDHPQVQAMQEGVDTATGNGAKISAERSRIENALDNIHGIIPGGKNEFKVGDMTIHNHSWGSGYYIDENKKEHLSKEDVIQLLEDKGYFDQFAKNQPNSTEESFTLNGHQYTREELKKSGWNDAQIDKLK